MKIDNQTFNLIMDRVAKGDTIRKAFAFYKINNRIFYQQMTREQRILLKQQKMLQPQKCMPSAIRQDMISVKFAKATIFYDEIDYRITSPFEYDNYMELWNPMPPPDRFVYSASNINFI